VSFDIKSCAPTLRHPAEAVAHSVVVQTIHVDAGKTATCRGTAVVFVAEELMNRDYALADIGRDPGLYLQLSQPGSNLNALSLRDPESFRVRGIQRGPVSAELLGQRRDVMRPGVVARQPACSGHEKQGILLGRERRLGECFGQGLHEVRRSEMKSSIWRSKAAVEQLPEPDVSELDASR
jgi:hypothetical protein